MGPFQRSGNAWVTLAQLIMIPVVVAVLIMVVMEIRSTRETTKNVSAVARTTRVDCTHRDAHGDCDHVKLTPVVPVAAVSPSYKGAGQQLFAPLGSASLGKPEPKQLCVITLPPTGANQAMSFCTDFRNVHVFAKAYDRGDGTYAMINYHTAHADDGPMGGSIFTTTFTDFITVYVQTEAERVQWQTDLDSLQKSLYSPRPVKLDYGR
jgi:hypothetical protein